MKKLLACILSLFPFLLFGQFTDDFSDGDFINNPTWEGDTGKFIVFGVLPIVNPMLRLYAPSAADNSYLSIGSKAINNASWEFYVELSFNPSASNLAKVYLTSNKSDLKTPLNGYFVKIGGTTDEISLYRQTGLTEIKIVDGIDGRVNNDPVKVRIKVMRDSLGNWNLLSDTLGGTNYFIEGGVFDTTYSSSDFFGVSCLYTATRSTSFYFDDFVVSGSPFIDTFPPKIDTILALSSNELFLNFTKPVETTTAENPANYFVNNGIGNPATASRDASDSSMVHLTFSNSFQNGITNTITVTNIQDLNGNQLTSISKDFLYFIPDTANNRDVIINELFPDPDPPVHLPAVEFVELYNRSAKSFDLSGWVLSDGSSNAVLGSFPLLPGEYVIICPSTSASLFIPFGSTLGVSNFPSLNNTNDNITLQDNFGKLIDAVSYSDTWYQDAIKKNGGWTLERIDSDFPCPASGNWTASNDTSGGTPGKVNSVLGNYADTSAPRLISFELLSLNSIKIIFSEALDSATAKNKSNYTADNGIGNPDSVISEASLTQFTLFFTASFDSGTVYTFTVSGVSDCAGNIQTGASETFALPLPATPGDVNFTEFFPDPEPVIGLPDVEFVEIFNRSQKAISLNGWILSDASTAATLGNMLLLPGEYLIICASANASQYQPFGKVLGVSSLPSLNNTSDVFTLKNSAGITMDRVSYSDSWYGDDIKKDGGWTLERIDPDFPCPSAGNWSASNDPSGGTPGKQNSIFGVYNDTIRPSVLAVGILSQTSVMLAFSERLDSSSAIALSNYSVDNGIGNPMVVSLDSSFMKVTLTFSTAFDSTTIYTLQISGVMDCIGNDMQGATIQFAIPQEPARHDVLITEILADPEPSAGLPLYEFVELFNRSDKTINLGDLTFSDAGSPVQLNDRLLFPNEYIILCPVAAAEEFRPFGNVQGISFPSLTNSGEPLTLRNKSGDVIHYVEFSDKWYTSSLKKAGGFSLEMVDTDNPCSGNSNWRETQAAIGGTPGAKNSVAGENADNQAPSLLRALLTDSFSVVLYFNETLDPASIQSAQYSIAPGNISITGAEGTPPAFTEMVLTLSDTLVPKTVYTIAVSNLTDCTGNAIGLENEAKVGVPEPITSGDLEINEVLFNPASGGVDFVELFNHSDKILDLKEMVIAEADPFMEDVLTEDARITLKGFQVFPKEYIALTSDPEIVKAQYYTPNPQGLVKVSGMPNYPDDEGVVLLLDTSRLYPQGGLLGKFHYYSDWHFALLDDENGVSLERISYDRPIQDQNNWHSAASTVGYATPAYQNSQFGENLSSSTDFSINPEVISPDGDGYQDYLNIYYQFDEPGYVTNIKIYDDQGREIRNLVSNLILETKGVLTWDGVDNDGKKARVGVYVLFAELFNLQGDKSKFRKTFVVAGKF